MKVSLEQDCCVVAQAAEAVVESFYVGELALHWGNTDWWTQELCV